MFYANFVLSKRGPLARIWLAAHWDKKLTKAHVFETNLEDSVETIISPQVKMALRTSGHLLLGVVRIYNRKAKYLLADCNEAFVKIKMAFRPGMVDLPEENREAQHNQIYLVEEFHNFDAPLPDISDIDMDRHLTVTTLNQSRIDEITLPEEVPTTLRLDDGFGDDMMGFSKNMDDQYAAGDLQNMFYKDDDGKDGFEMDGGLKDGFGGEMSDGLIGGGFMQGPGLFGEKQEEAIDGEAASKQDTVTAMDIDGAMDISSPHPQPVVVEGQEETQSESQKQLQVTTTEPSIEEATNVVPEEAKLTINEEEDNKDQTTLVANEEEAFALGPLDVSDVRDMRMRRKRKLVVDHLMELDGQTMREQLKDFNDIVTTLDMAPPTKRLMQWKEMGGVDKLFSIPSKTTDASINKLIFLANLHHTIPADLLNITHSQLNEQYGDSGLDDTTFEQRRDGFEASVPDAVEILDQSNSVIMQRKDPSMNQQPVAGYNSEDDYEPYSMGPQSVASSLGVGSPHPFLHGIAQELPRPDAISLHDASIPHLEESNLQEPLLSDTGISDHPIPPSPGVDDESFADDLEDLRWNKRTQHLLHSLQHSFKHEQEVTFFRMTEGAMRKQAVSKFYSLLVLAKQEATMLSQKTPFGEVYIQKGTKFDAILM